MLRLTDLAQRSDFRLGDLCISPARRRVEGPKGTSHVEPQWMFVFLRLLASVGEVATRQQLFDECWGGAPVGDDSLNRAVAGARQIGRRVGSRAFTIETVPRTGYTLRLAPSVKILPAQSDRPPSQHCLETVVEEAYDCWRSGLPIPDRDAIKSLQDALIRIPDDARAWGMYALLLRKAAEYADADESADFVRQCEQAARRALALIPDQSDALVALAGVVPIFGNWSSARKQLASVVATAPNHVPAAHDLAVLENGDG